MDPKEIEAELCSVLALLGEEDDDGVSELVGTPFETAEILTFEEVGMMEAVAGLVLRLRSGDEFQVTIVRTR